MRNRDTESHLGGYKSEGNVKRKRRESVDFRRPLRISGYSGIFGLANIPGPESQVEAGIEWIEGYEDEVSRTSEIYEHPRGLVAAERESFARVHRVFW